MQFKANLTLGFLCAMFIATPVARAQVYEFEFITSAPGFAGELFFNASSGSGPFYQVLAGNSFITTPDGTFTVAQSVQGGPLGFPIPPTVWSPGGITALNLGLYEVLNSQIYYWTATPNSIGDSPVGAIPLGVPLNPPSDATLVASLGASANGTWVYISTVPEPGTTSLMALTLAVILFCRRDQIHLRSLCFLPSK